MAVELLEIGRVDKPHGLRGEVVATLTTNRPGRLAPGVIVHVGDHPMTVLSSKPHQHRFIVAFEGIVDRDGADRIHGAMLRAGRIDDDPEELWVDRLIGAEVVGIDGTAYGTVEALEPNPASDLLVLADGGLVPLTFVVSHEQGRVVIDPPVGLFDR
ncbi:ribosome maturation factor RimM [soil metagenome]